MTRDPQFIEAAAPEAIVRLCGASGPLQLLAEETRDGKKLRPFKMVGYTGASMVIPGFWHPVVVDLAGMTVSSQRLPIFRQHDPDRIVAHSEAVGVTPQGVDLTGVMSGTGDAAREVLDLAANQFPWQASIGASIERREFVEPGSTVKVNGRNFTGPINVARASTLREVSFVPLGADPGTSATFAARGGKNVEFDTYVAAAGFDPQAMSDQQRSFLRARFDADHPAPPTHSAADRERERVEGIATDRDDIVAVSTGTDGSPERVRAVADRAIAGGWDRSRAEVEMIRASRPVGPGVSVARDTHLDQEVVECGLAMGGSLDRIDTVYPAAVCEAARKRWKGGLSLVECASVVARRNGFRGDTIRGHLKEILRAAAGYGGFVRADAGPSTYSIPNILSNVANKFALAGFYSVDQTWSSIAARRSTNDLKQITSLRLTGNLQFLRLPPSGEIKSGEIGERAYLNQAHTFARNIGISREDWINDDTGALTGTARELGIGGGDAINNEFWTVFLNNGTFFTAGNNNVGPAGVLSLASIGAADAVFRLQTKPNGRPLGLSASLLLVPVAKRIDALNAINSTLVVASTTTDKPLPNQNVLQGAYTVLSSPYLSNPAYTGNSAAAFYLLALPGQLAVIEGVFLYGIETPTIETAEFDFDQLGTSLRGWLDMGFALQEFRGGVRSPGV